MTTNFDTMVELHSKEVANVNQIFSREFFATIKQYLMDNDMVGLYWRQYTPFNDGDETWFSLTVVEMKREISNLSELNEDEYHEALYNWDERDDSTDLFEYSLKSKEIDRMFNQPEMKRFLETVLGEKHIFVSASGAHLIEPYGDR